MIENPSLAKAKAYLDDKQFDQAIGIYQNLLSEGSHGAAEAAYNLGIIYQAGSGVRSDKSEAKKYYTISEDLGYPMATYRIASMHFANGEAEMALACFKKIADQNPSAAYWVFRILKDHATETEKNSARTYLYLADKLGHVLAKRIIAMENIKGRNGILNIPAGIIMYFSTVKKMIEVVRDNDKIKYT
ncbi:tetratricopeptide repeat protein [Mesorhizobium captivum]|uniref:tetratricopeptide repeat protein n=1 Tax=Mesorhizobium captivum TaxID=3072319 RepID=UPI002A2449DF|nr:hypothetical protein [Mesorhizobium sp. VK3C]MDX8448504.1 hypothetical protein [Mesorhizobium sp. VK3C]